jgi:hypothetical protein
MLKVTGVVAATEGHPVKGCTVEFTAGHITTNIEIHP